MLSKHDLVFNPEKIQPLGTRKGVLNKPTDILIDMKQLFLSYGNTEMLIESLYNVYQQNGGQSTREKFSKLILLLQKKFLKENNVYMYETAENQATGFNNYVEALRAVNKDFTLLTYKYFRWNVYNPFHNKIEVGPSDQRVMKSSDELTHEDHQTIDVWREQFVQVLNKQFRDRNRIPIYRASIHKRHYDRSNEGLQFNDPDRASLETPIYGYCMNQINKGICNFHTEEWYGF